MLFYGPLGPSWHCFIWRSCVNGNADAATLGAFSLRNFMPGRKSDRGVYGARIFNRDRWQSSCYLELVCRRCLRAGFCGLRGHCFVVSVSAQGATTGLRLLGRLGGCNPPSKQTPRRGKALSALAKRQLLNQAIGILCPCPAAHVAGFNLSPSPFSSLDPGRISSADELHGARGEVIKFCLILNPAILVLAPCPLLT